VYTAYSAVSIGLGKCLESSVQSAGLGRRLICFTFSIFDALPPAPGGRESDYPLSGHLLFIESLYIEDLYIEELSRSVSGRAANDFFRDTRFSPDHLNQQDPPEERRRYDALQGYIEGAYCSGYIQGKAVGTGVCRSVSSKRNISEQPFGV
jgi:hypothetical protein